MFECGPWGWSFWWIFPLFIIVMVIFCIFMMRRFGCMSSGHFMGKESLKPSVDSAEEILKRRYDLGEITKKEYEEMKLDIV